MCCASTSHTSYIFWKWTWETFGGLELPKGGEVCYCQYQKSVLVLVNFQDKLIQCKLLDYILSMLLKVVI